MFTRRPRVASTACPGGPLRRRHPARALVRPLLFLLVVAALLVAGEELGLREALDPERLRAMGASPTPGLVAAIAGLWVLMIGGSLPAVAAGTALFGWTGGALVSLLGAVLAHSLWFGLARTSLRAIVWSRGGPRLRWVVALIERGGLGLVVAWNLLGAPGGVFLFAAALSRLPYRTFLLGLLASLPRFLILGLLVDTVLTWELGAVPASRWILLAEVGLPLVGIYAALLGLRPELRPWRFGDPDVAVEADDAAGPAAAGAGGG